VHVFAEHGATDPGELWTGTVLLAAPLQTARRKL
jgi:hypothetical protein